MTTLCADATTADADDTPTELCTLQVDATMHGQRLDHFLTQKIPAFSRSYLQQLATTGFVQINGVVVRKPATKVKLADRIAVALVATPQSQAYIPQAMSLDWIYQDEHLGVLNKPAGLVVHPAAGNWSGTLLNGLLAHDAKASLLPRAGIVHRLDKDTSGLMLVARSRVAMEALVTAIAQRQVQRHYWALAHGRLPPKTSRLIDAAIGRDPRNRLRMRVLGAHCNTAKAAQTEIYCLNTTENTSWLECRLLTGRTHQIRAHARYIGHALLGDSLYGGETAYGMTRQALHAWHLALEHPITKATLRLYAPVPQDMAHAMQQLGFHWSTMQTRLQDMAHAMQQLGFHWSTMQTRL